MSRTESSALSTLRRRLEARADRPIDVLGVGEACLDDVWLLDGALARGGKSRARRFTLGGGQIATALVALARLGRRAAFAGAVGDDAAGAAVLDGLAAEGVGVSGARRVAGATRAAVILVEEGGARSVIEQVDARVRPAADDALAAALDGARLVHLDATHLAASVHVARMARERGVPVSLDVDAAQPGLEELLAIADVCLTSEELPFALHRRAGAGDDERDLGAALRSLGERALTGCTLGARGAAALDGDHLVLAPAFPVEAVDTTACGDVFHAAALCALLDGRTVADTLRFANAAAALKCRALGRLGCPTRAEVDALLGA